MEGPGVRYKNGQYFFTPANAAEPDTDGNVELAYSVDGESAPVLVAILELPEVDFNPEKAAVCVVMAAGGYPDKYEKGFAIDGIDKVDQLPNAFVFHAGTKLTDGSVATSGGRVLGVTALGDNIKFAIENAYRAVSLIKFKNMHYRKDIGKKALKYLI